MTIKSQRDFWSGIMFLIVGLAFAWGSTEYSFGSSVRPGPAYFPFGLGVLLAILGCAVLFKALTLKVGGGDPIGAIAWKPLLIIAGAIVMFGFTLPRLGLAISLPLLVTVAAMAGDEFRWRDALVNAVMLTVGSWAIFVWGLALVIPVWPPIFGF